MGRGAWRIQIERQASDRGRAVVWRAGITPQGLRQLGLLVLTAASLVVAAWLLLGSLARPLPEFDGLRIVRGTVASAQTDCDRYACTFWVTVAGESARFKYVDSLPHSARVERAVRPGVPVVMGAPVDGYAAGGAVEIWHVQAGDRIVVPFADVLTVKDIQRSIFSLTALALLAVSAIATAALYRSAFVEPASAGAPGGRASARLGQLLGRPALHRMGAAIGTLALAWVANRLYWLSALDAAGSAELLWLAMTVALGGLTLIRLARLAVDSRLVRWSLIVAGIASPFLLFVLGWYVLPLHLLGPLAGPNAAEPLATLLVLGSPVVAYFLMPLLAATLQLAPAARRTVLLAIGASSIGESAWIALTFPERSGQLTWLGIGIALAIWGLFLALRVNGLRAAPAPDPVAVPGGCWPTPIVS